MEVERCCQKRFVTIPRQEIDDPVRTTQCERRTPASKGKYSKLPANVAWKEASWQKYSANNTESTYFPSLSEKKNDDALLNFLTETSCLGLPTLSKLHHETEVGIASTTKTATAAVVSEVTGHVCLAEARQIYLSRRLGAFCGIDGLRVDLLCLVLMPTYQS